METEMIGGTGFVNHWGLFVSLFVFVSTVDGSRSASRLIMQIISVTYGKDKSAQDPVFLH